MPFSISLFGKKRFVNRKKDNMKNNTIYVVFCILEIPPMLSTIRATKGNKGLFAPQLK